MKGFLSIVAVLAICICFASFNKTTRKYIPVYDQPVDTFINKSKTGSASTLQISLGGTRPDSALILPPIIYADTATANYSKSASYSGSLILVSGGYMYYRTLNPNKWNLVATGTIPSQFNPSAGYGVTLSGSYPNITFTVDTSKIIPYTDTLKSNGIATKSNVALKVNISDTSVMLAPYLRSSDTSSMLAGYVSKTTTVSTNAPLAGGGALSGNLTLVADTGRSISQLTTGGSLNKVKDSLVGLISGGGFGTVLSVSTTNAYGISSTVTNPTSTPNITIQADTTPGKLSTRLHVDSVAMRKVNYTDTASMLSGYNLQRVTNLGASTNNSITAPNFIGNLKSSSSAGGDILSNSGTLVAEWGLGGGSNMTFYGFTGYDANRSSSYTSRSFPDKNYVDSSDALRVLYTDTASMLTPYLRKSDTATMLSGYTRVQRFLDTTSTLRSLINTKGTGTVTSVGLSLPAFLTVSGSPVTTSGTLTASLSNQTANTVFAGPTTGSAAQPTFRSLVAADLTASTLQTVTDNGGTTTNLTTFNGGINGTTALFTGSIQSGDRIFSQVGSGLPSIIESYSLSGQDAILIANGQSSTTQYGVPANKTGVGSRSNHDFVFVSNSKIAGTISSLNQSLTWDSSITANSFIKAGGTSSQFLKADGSVDGTAYGTGTVTSISTNNGTGITGGTITTSGTISADTLNLSTRLWRQKGVDSVMGQVGLKLNISDTSSMLANRLKISDTATMLSKLTLDRVLQNGNVSGRSLTAGLINGTTGTFSGRLNSGGGGGGTSSLNAQQGSGDASAISALGVSTTGSSKGINILAGTNTSDYALSVKDYNGNIGLYVRGDLFTGLGTISPSHRLHVSGGIYGDTIIKSGGTSTQSLMADGSVLTVSSSNTASAIVQRDGSGNFAANIITGSKFIGSSAASNGIDAIQSGGGSILSNLYRSEGKIQASNATIDATATLWNDNSGSNVTYTLPSTSSLTGGRFFFIKTGAGTLTLSAYASNKIVLKNGSTASTVALTSTDGLNQYYFDGNLWYQIN